MISLQNPASTPESKLWTDPVTPTSRIHLILVGGAHHIQEEVNAALVDDGHASEKCNLT